MFDPSAVFYMEKLAVGPEAADVVDITAPVAENIRRVAKAKHSDVGDVTVCILDRPRHERPRQGGPRGRGADPASSPTATSPARSRRPAPGTGVDMLLGIGGTPGGHHRGLRAEVHGRRDPGPAVAAGRDGAAEGDRRRPRPRPGAAPPTTWSAATTCSSSPPASPTATCCAVCTTAAAGDDAVHRDAVEVRHRSA